MTGPFNYEKMRTRLGSAGVICEGFKYILQRRARSGLTFRCSLYRSLNCNACVKIMDGKIWNVPDHCHGKYEDKTVKVVEEPVKMENDITKTAATPKLIKAKIEKNEMKPERFQLSKEKLLQIKLRREEFKHFNTSTNAGNGTNKINNNNNINDKCDKDKFEDKFRKIKSKYKNYKIKFLKYKYKYNKYIYGKTYVK